MKLATVRTYVSEIGRLAYGSVCIVILLFAGIEFFSPGLIANFVAPQTLVGCAVIAGGLALIATPESSKAVHRSILYAVVCAAAAIVAFSASWYYFSSVPAAQAPLAYAFGAVVALLFLAYV